MGGFFGIASRRDAIADLYYGTDYHSHLGTKRGGLAVQRDDGLRRVIHNIENAQFRSKFDDDIGRMHACSGIGVISDTDDQPLLIRSHLGDFAIATVGTVKNASDLAGEAFRSRRLHFSEMGGGDLNPTELVATLINQGQSFEEGIADRPGFHRRVLLDPPAHEGRPLRRPGQAGPDAGHHRQEPRERRRDDGDLRPSQSGLRDLEGPGAG